VVISERDETTFSLWYRQSLGERPDVVVVDRRLLFYAWYQGNLLRRYPDLDPAALKPGRLTMLKRPIYTLVDPSGAETLPLVAVDPLSTTNPYSLHPTPQAIKINVY
jgi:hypothetical protein